jgi:hypothetical protein
VSWTDSLKKAPIAQFGGTWSEFIFLDSPQDISGDIEEHLLGLD